MRSALVLAAFIATAPVAVADTPSEEATARVAHQHTAIAVLSAMHYCKTQRWPRSLKAIKKAWAGKAAPLPVALDWELLQSKGVSYEARANLVLRTPKGVVPDASLIVTTNKPPGCNGNHVELKAAMLLGE